MDRKNIKTMVENLENFFLKEGKAKITIPAYQRPYSWDLKQCEVLYEDINQNFKKNQDFFVVHS